MSQPSRGGFLALLISLLNRLFGGKNQPPAPAPITDSPVDPPAQVTAIRVLLVVYDPVMDGASGQRLSSFMGWQDPDVLVPAFVGDVLETSDSLARFSVVERIDVDEFPAKVDGFRYTPQTYLDVIRHKTPPRAPEGVDYHAILRQFNIIERVQSNQVDEVWVFAFPHAGFYESTMAGAGAFWCNAPPIAGTSSCPKRFIVMGFSYERGVGEMLEAFGHRAESMLEKTFSHLHGVDNLFDKFTLYDKIAPGEAGMGNIHFAPNSDHDYDWGNPRVVASDCDDWYNFPNFTGETRQVDASEWGGGEIRAHHKWWFDHIPRVAGRQNGIANNWWQYIMDANRVKP